MRYTKGWDRTRTKETFGAHHSSVQPSACAAPPGTLLPLLVPLPCRPFRLDWPLAPAIVFPSWGVQGSLEPVPRLSQYRHNQVSIATDTMNGGHLDRIGKYIACVGGKSVAV